MDEAEQLLAKLPDSADVALIALPDERLLWARRCARGNRLTGGAEIWITTLMGDVLAYRRLRRYWTRQDFLATTRRVMSRSGDRLT